jgi:hypothetical protein
MDLAPLCKSYQRNTKQETEKGKNKKKEGRGILFGRGAKQARSPASPLPERVRLPSL